MEVNSMKIRWMNVVLVIGAVIAVFLIVWNLKAVHRLWELSAGYEISDGLLLALTGMMFITVLGLAKIRKN